MKKHTRFPSEIEHRDYAVFAERVRSLRKRGWEVREQGEVCGLPLFAAELTHFDDGSIPQVLLVGGIHGDEPAGVEATVAWMESGRAARWPVNWLVLPCANPCGWLHNRRTASFRHDLNRSFNLTKCCAELQFVRQALSGRHFLFAMDFHEDTEAPGYYICEIKTRAPFAGEQIVADVESILPIWDAPKLDGRRISARGCVRRSPVTRSVLARRRLWPLEFHLIRHHTSHTFCSETPRSFPMEQRVRAHHVALETALASALPNNLPDVNGSHP